MGLILGIVGGNVICFFLGFLAATITGRPAPPIDFDDGTTGIGAATEVRP